MVNTTDKKLVMNVINGNTIGDLLGFETDTWIGKQITLFTTQTEFGGKNVDCIRIRVPSMTGTTKLTGAPPATPPAEQMIPAAVVPAARVQQAPPKDEIPF